MASIIINRSSEFHNKLRNIDILVDGVKVDDVADGETKGIELSEGTHIIHCKLDWCESPKIDINIPNLENIEFNLSGFKVNKKITWAIIFLSLFLLIPESVSHINPFYIAPFVIGYFIYRMYYISLGRKKYLRLEKRN